MHTQPLTKDEQKMVLTVSDELNAELVLYCGSIQAGHEVEIQTWSTRKKTRKNLIVMLHTMGGNADAAYRIARSFQRRVGDGSLAILPVLYCKSAGTLLALGADKILMDTLSELGPLDVQISKKDDISGHLSGLTMVDAFDQLNDIAYEHWEAMQLKIINRSYSRISFKLAAQIAREMTVGLLSGVYSQLDPIQLGEHSRMMSIAHKYGEALSRGNLKENALGMLVAGYPSHGHVIDGNEACNLFKVVEEPSASLQELVNRSQLVISTMETMARQDTPVVRFLTDEAIMAQLEAEQAREATDEEGRHPSGDENPIRDEQPTAGDTDQPGSQNEQDQEARITPRKRGRAGGEAPPGDEQEIVTN